MPFWERFWLAFDTANAIALVVIVLVFICVLLLAAAVVAQGGRRGIR